jgi:hypothetical protein
MIKLKNILNEISEEEADRLLSKIKNKEITFLDKGDNGKVYSINGEDLLLKITTEPEETAVADVIVGRPNEFDAFIPVYYSDSQKNMYIMNRASKLTNNLKSELDQYYNDYKEYARSQGLETSIFNFLNTEASRNYSPTIITFLRALEQQVKKTGIGDLELSLDFRPENIMLWNGSLVMIDW